MQEILPEHMASQYLQFKLDFETGKNYARIPGGDAADCGWSGSASLVCAISFQPAGNPTIRCQVSTGMGDGLAVAKQLSDAVSWGDCDRTRHLLRSCYCTSVPSCSCLPFILHTANSVSTVTLVPLPILTTSTTQYQLLVDMRKQTRPCA